MEKSGKVGTRINSHLLVAEVTRMESEVFDRLEARVGGLCWRIDGQKFLVELAGLSSWNGNDS